MATVEDQREAHGDTAPAAPDTEEAPRETNADEQHAGEAPPQEKEKRERGRMDFIPDIVRRTFYAGLGAVFTTEEGIRKIASDLKLPKDVANYLIQQAGASKDELFRVLGKELRGFLESVNISGELQKLLTSLSFEIKTEIRFIPNEQAIGGVKPDVKVGRFSLRRNRDRDRDEERRKRDRNGSDEE